MSRRGPWFALICLATSGCTPGLAVGAACVRDSDCPAPYACLAGRCREECVDSRDCYPLACVEVQNDLGACRVVEDDGCDGCAAPLTCVAGRCEDPCDDVAECVPGNECSAGRCIPSDAPPVGACSPVAARSGCAEGQSCSRDGDTFACRSASAALELGEACSGDAACGTGAGCVSGRCARLCVLGETSCGIASLCTADATLFGPTPGVSVGPSPPPGFGYCTEVCDPLAPPASDGCPDGLTCSNGQTTGGRQFSYCRDIVAPVNDVYGDCSGGGLAVVRCPAGTVCEVIGGGTMRLCRPYCDPTAAMPCADDTACFPFMLGNDVVGLCTGPG